MIKIAVDAMGGDNAPEITVLGAINAIQEFKDIEIILFGDQEKIKPYLTNNERISIVHTTSFISMGEHDPVNAIRKQKEASMVLAMEACKNGLADCVVSAGPTQALIVGAHLIIKKIPSMHRVALCPIVPSLDGRGKLLLDVGANVELRAEHLLELAVYANILAKIVLHVDEPKIGLINIGTEEGKGREVDKETYNLFKNQKMFNFVGNVEPKEMFFFDVDVLVTDGYTGNILLKTLEGTAKVTGEMLKEEIKRKTKGKIGYLFLKDALKRYKMRLDSKEVGGAMIVGVTAPVVKAHGSSDAYAFKNAIRQVRSIVLGNVINEVTKIIKEG